MSCVGLRTGGGIAIQANRIGDRTIIPGPNRVQVGPMKSGCSQKKAMAVECSSAALSAVEVGQGGTHMRGGPEKFDHWMRESVGEIVKNLREAPLFVHVYGGGGGGGGAETKLKAERAVAEDWGHLKGKWVKGEEPSPEGIILVEELKEGDVEIMEEDEGQNWDCTKAWGVLIQRRGEDGGVACYLLKTSQVGCGNLGVFCTHYCLIRVKNFRETARSQLTSCWLV